jgi:hypothetical protein
MGVEERYVQGCQCTIVMFCVGGAEPKRAWRGFFCIWSFSGTFWEACRRLSTSLALHSVMPRCLAKLVEPQPGTRASSDIELNNKKVQT